MPANHYNRGSVQRNLDHRTAKLSEDFGYDYACRLFGKEAIDSLPRLEAGKNKGKIRGFLHWRKATKAGYYRECAGPCKEGGLIDAWIGEHMGTTRDNATYGEWFGRKQSMAGSRSVFTAEYREGEMRRQAEQAAEMAEIRARIAGRGDPMGVL